MYYFYFIYVIQKCWFETLLYFKTVFYNLKFNYTTIYKMILLPCASFLIIYSIIFLISHFHFSFKNLFFKNCTVLFSKFEKFQFSTFSQFWILLNEVRVQFSSVPLNVGHAYLGHYPPLTLKKSRVRNYIVCTIWLTYLTVPLKHPQGYRLAVIPTDFHFLRHAPI